MPASRSPVSYTHLDVYKRQVLYPQQTGTLNSCIPRRIHSCRGVQQTLSRRATSAFNHQNRFIARGTTDVYKRQSSGNLVEWFDFYVYSFCSLYFAHIFFPSGNTTTQLLQTAGVFAAGFLMRPIGGWLFGRIADKHGRKKSMLLSVCMMCFGSLVIACLPGYETCLLYTSRCV